MWEPGASTAQSALPGAKQTLRFVRFRRPAAPGQTPGGVQDLHLRMSAKQPAYAPLILQRCKGTGGVYQSAARPQHGRGTIQYPILPGGAPLHILRTPLLPGVLIFAEHPLAGAGSIHQDTVKIPRKNLRQPFRRLVQNQAVANPQPFHILRQYPGPLGMDLIAHQQSPAPHPPGDLGAFTSGGGAEVQHLLPRFRPQKNHRGHGTGLLDVIDPRFMVGMSARAGKSMAVVKAFLLPGHSLQMPGAQGQKTLPGFLRTPPAFQRIHPQRPVTFPLQSLQELPVFVSQL